MADNDSVVIVNKMKVLLIVSSLYLVESFSSDGNVASVMLEFVDGVDDRPAFRSADPPYRLAAAETRRDRLQERLPGGRRLAADDHILAGKQFIAVLEQATSFRRLRVQHGHDRNARACVCISLR